ncbi:P-type conjugative transfer ATPase TrbB [Rhodocyclaceae bacterium]
MQNETTRRREDALARALGPELLKPLQDLTVIEILLNPDGKVWIERLGGHQLEHAGQIDQVRAMSIIATVASMLETTVTADRPILECELPNDGSRFEALIPPVVQAPVFSIRKKASAVFTLDQYIQAGIMSQRQREAVLAAIVQRKNILIAGGTGTGKTTLANAVLDAIANHEPEHRIVIIEDTRELQCQAPNTVYLRTSDTVDQTMLLRATMRLRPDRIVVGEVRDKSALALLKAWNTGHPGGVGTVHANDAAAALVRVGQLIQEAGVPPAPDLIAEAVNVVVSIKRDRGARRIGEIVVVSGYDSALGFRFERVA